MNHMPAAIAIEGLTKHYRRVDALTDLTLDVPKGSIFGFLGPNGAGKTTALKLLAGLTQASAGHASVNGVPIGLQGAHRAQIGYLAQEPRFYGWMTGRQTLAYVASFYGTPRPRGWAEELLELVGLTDAADRTTKTYSGGMRQRLGIGQALAGDASVILLDEPAASLDPLGRHDVLELMSRLRGDKTIFYSTHILDDVQRVSDHVAILDHGRLVMTAPTADLVARSSGGHHPGEPGGGYSANRTRARHPGRGRQRAVRGAAKRANGAMTLTPAAGATRGRAAGSDAVRRRPGPGADHQPAGIRRPGGHLPPHRERGACGMNATTWPLQGFWPFFWKELSEWWKGRGALATVVVLSALGTLGTFATRIDELGGGIPTAAQLDADLQHPGRPVRAMDRLRVHLRQHRDGGQRAQ